MNYLSVCSGIEAATVAWHPLGWTPVAFAEIEKFPCAVLAHHYPSIPNWGDMTTFKDWPDADVDVLVGGTPCQSFSVAGLRKGLADPRGNLALTYLAIADKYRPEWLVWENVPGVLSSTSNDGADPCPPNGGVEADPGSDDEETENECLGDPVVAADEYDANEVHAFACFLAGLSELGYGWAYRVLDAQYFGLAQRRKRVFVVASLRGWQRAAAVLFDSESLRGNPAPRREAGEGATYRIAPSLTASGRGTQRTGESRGQDGVIPSLRTRAPGFSGQGTDSEQVVMMLGDVAPTIDAMINKKFGSNQWVDSGQFVMCASDGQANASINDDLAPTLTKQEEQPYVAFDARQSNVNQYGEKTGPLDTHGYSMAVRQSMQVRRLTPRECERLQGFPDDYTLIPYRGKPAADGPRYKALGNSMAVPVMRWIGERIQMVAQISEI